MPEAILKFNLPEEAEEHLNALNGHLYRYAIEEYDTILRNRQKYKGDEAIPIEEARQLLSKALRMHVGINRDA